MSATGISNKEPTRIGKMKSFGLHHVWQVALLLPIGWDDLRTVVGAAEFGRVIRTEVLDSALFAVESTRENGRVAFAC